MKTLVGGSTATQVSLHICGDRKGGFSKAQIEEAKLGKVRANEGDAWCVAVRGFRCFLFSSSVMPSVPGILCSPFGARPLKAMLRRMSSTAEAEIRYAKELPLLRYALPFSFSIHPREKMLTKMRVSEGILCSPFGARPLKAMLRRMSSTAEAERSLAIT
jgi:hypothetical protein